MKKFIKRFLLSVVFAISINILFIILLLFGVFDTFLVKNIATYQSPNETYVLSFQQLGDPFLFGPTKVRLLLKDQDGRRVHRLDTEVSNDGAPAYEGNIQSITWYPNSVMVRLQGPEMEDSVVELPIQKVLFQKETQTP